MIFWICQENIEVLSSNSEGSDSEADRMFSQGERGILYLCYGRCLQEIAMVVVELTDNGGCEADVEMARLNN